MAKAIARVIQYEDRQPPAVVVVIGAEGYSKPPSDDEVNELLRQNDAATVIRKIRLAAKRRMLRK